MNTYAQRSPLPQSHGGSILPDLDPEQLRHFHQAHFPCQNVPHLSLTSNQEEQEQDQQGDQELGCYPDGIKRTLTDDQVAMFRHSEIQRLLSERRQARANQEKEGRRQQRKPDGKAFRPPRVDCEPVQQQHNADTLVYDDETPVEQKQTDPKERKFLWPTLAG
jgi:hypothetical protein